MVPIYAFLRHSGKVPDFHDENSGTCHLTFAMKIRHRFTLGDMDHDNHNGRGELVYLYTYIMHNASTQSRKVNRGHHTQEMRTNGTWHDINNTTHLREKGRRKEGILKENTTKWERLDP